ncbi:uncharacterized protein MONBRDRAFT_22861 [Monosiga brevicollis MX1]|uniref:Transmembrane protein n=1 Tax=Monosiga brevicollis TaxID=81824 RepID=A9USA4_MONBE|nr:uncharacterized protein MONBRDRAFT_22861 [Monosiga brevicollis MX1]EDQ91747.1 predicted protein [Monosiga brevicollis MX1]|eukprot:XP_001743033.1 hypothetical protein [Monosiga brevicollis MX1]
MSQSVTIITPRRHEAVSLCVYVVVVLFLCVFALYFSLSQTDQTNSLCLSLSLSLCLSCLSVSLSLSFDQRRAQDLCKPVLEVVPVTDIMQPQQGPSQEEVMLMRAQTMQTFAVFAAYCAVLRASASQHSCYSQYRSPNSVPVASFF